MLPRAVPIPSTERRRLYARRRRVRWGRKERSSIAAIALWEPSKSVNAGAKRCKPHPHRQTQVGGWVKEECLQVYTRCE
jgi:hypothetical protein